MHTTKVVRGVDQDLTMTIVCAVAGSKAKRKVEFVFGDETGKDSHGMTSDICIVGTLAILLSRARYPVYGLNSKKSQEADKRPIMNPIVTLKNPFRASRPFPSNDSAFSGYIIPIDD
jgi:hypothetical protein